MKFRSLMSDFIRCCSVDSLIIHGSVTKFAMQCEIICCLIINSLEKRVTPTIVSGLYTKSKFIETLTQMARLFPNIEISDNTGDDTGMDSKAEYLRKVLAEADFNPIIHKKALFRQHGLLRVLIKNTKQHSLTY